LFEGETARGTHATILPLSGRATGALDAGRVYLALSEMGKAEVSSAGVAGVKEHQGASFEKEWNQAAAELTALDGKAREKNWTGAPAAIRALAESAQGKSMPLFQTSRAYAGVTDARWPPLCLNSHGRRHTICSKPRQ
jgi:hypothetical protein